MAMRFGSPERFSSSSIVLRNRGSSPLFSDVRYKCRTYAFAHMIGVHIHLRQQCGIFNQVHKGVADRSPVSGKRHPEQAFLSSLKQYAFRHRI